MEKCSTGNNNSVLDLGCYPFQMAEITIEKKKFDALLNQMLKTAPLPKSEVKTKGKGKKRKKVA
jgi:hypothetical protein